MIDFSAFYSWIYKSFNISDDALFAKNLENEKIESAVLIKRSWVFGLYLSWMLALLLLLMATSVYLILYKNIGFTNTGWFVSGMLAINMLLLIYNSSAYLIYFKNTYCNATQVISPAELTQELTRWDKYFKRFFNQISFNYFLFFGIIGFVIYTFFSQNLIQNIWGIATIILLLSQISIMKYFRKKMIDLAMDFTVIIPGKIYFFNQTNMMKKSQMLEGIKVTTIKSDYTGFLGSFFNYGNVSVFVEGEDSSMMQLNFVTNPAQAVENILRVLWGEKAAQYNRYLASILEEIGYENPTENQEDLARNHKSEIHGYLQKHEIKIKQDFTNGDKEKQKEIQEIYKNFG